MIFANGLFALIQILTFCLLGTFIEISVILFYAYILQLDLEVVLLILQNDMLCESISSFDWYLLNRQEIQIYQLLLLHTQNPQCVTILNVQQLNMDACVSVIIFYSELL